VQSCRAYERVSIGRRNEKGSEVSRDSIRVGQSTIGKPRKANAECHRPGEYRHFPSHTLAALVAIFYRDF
jgi:hypothetical protein